MSTSVLRATYPILAASVVSLGCVNLGLTKYHESDIESFKPTVNYAPAQQCVRALTYDRNLLVNTEGAKKAISITGASVTLLGGVAAAILGSGQDAQIVQPPGDPPPPLAAKVDESAKTGTIVAAAITAVSGIASLIVGVIPTDQEGIERHQRREKHYNAALVHHFDKLPAYEGLQGAQAAVNEANERDKKAKAALKGAEEAAKTAKTAAENAKNALDVKPGDPELQKKYNDAKVLAESAAQSLALMKSEAEDAAKAMDARQKELEVADKRYKMSTTNVGISFTNCATNSSDTSLWPTSRK